MSLKSFAPSYGGVGLDPVLVLIFAAIMLVILGITAFVILRRRKK